MTSTTRRQALAAVAAGLLAAPAAVRAESPYPSRPIKLVVPFPPGAGPEVLIRQFLPKLGAAVGGSFFVENRVGAGGMIAADYVAQQPADGYTLLLGSSAQITQKLLQPKTGYDPLTSFTHVMRLSTTPSVLVVPGNSPYRTLDDLVKAARSAPAPLAYGSGGIGSPAHLAAAALAHWGRFEANHIPYRGSVDIPQALAGGFIQFAIPTVSTVLPLMQGGKLRALACTSAERDPSVPDVPTLKELTGSDDLVLVPWGCLWMPAGAPPAVVKLLFDGLTKVYADPELVKASAHQGITIALSKSPAEFAAFVAAEQAKMARIIKAAKIELN